MIETVTTSTRSTGSETSWARPARIRAQGPGSAADAAGVPTALSVSVVSGSVVSVSTGSNGSAAGGVLIVLTIPAAIRKHAAETANGAQGASRNSTPAASGPARSRARVSTVTNLALARSRWACGTIRTNRACAEPSAKVSAEVMANPKRHSSGIVVEPDTTVPTSAIDSTARSRWAVAITRAGSKRSTRAPAGIATSSHGRVVATATSATDAADEFTDTASSGSAITRRPSPVREPAQVITNREKDAGSWGPAPLGGAV